MFCYSEFFVDVVDGITRLPCKCNWCQFEVIGNDALWNSLPETDYIYTVAGLYKRVILLLKWYGFFELVCGNKAYIDNCVMPFLHCSLVSKSLNEGRKAMMENTGRDDLRDGRAGWLTRRVLRKRFRSSSHDAIT